MSNEVLLGLNKLLLDDSRLFFENMGGLHDCSLKKIEVGINKKYLVIEIDDLYSNFIGLEEYIECKNINLIFKNINLIKIELVNREQPTNPLKTGTTKHFYAILIYIKRPLISKNLAVLK